MEIKDAVILITGAAQRVGHLVALDLASHGANIAFSYFDESEPWHETMDALNAKGVRSFAQQADVTISDSVRSLVHNVFTQFGHIDVLINNASIWLKKPILQISEEEWDAEINVNLKGPFLMSQAVAPIMLKSGMGLIINITDLSAYQTWEGYAHHSAAKAGLVALTKSMALELAPTVRVNAIAPGTVLLPENADENKIHWAVTKSALKRIGSPDDVSRTIRYLIDEDFATGSVYFIDGGRSII